MTAPGHGAVPPSAASTAGVLSRGRIVDVTGRRVHVHDVGSGPPVMLLHGSGPGTTAAAWSSLAAAFAGTFRVIAPDFAGFGASEPWRAFPGDDAGRPYGRAAWTDQILGVADALGLERFAVVGNSMGGAIALSVAAARPDAVTKVVGIGTLGVDMPLPAGLDELWSYTPGREHARGLLELLHADRAYVTEEAIEARLRATLEPQPRAAFAEMFPPPRERWVRDLALDPEELRAIRAPVLLVHGAQDRVVPLESSTLVLLGLLRDVRAHVFGGVGHASPVERPAELARLLTTFLEDHD
jgi:2-hydroxymuconate-semialdehyde hydrolase